MDSEPDRAPELGVPIRVLPEDLAPDLSETELVADIWAADARQARDVAERAVSVSHFARRRRRQRDDEFGLRGGLGLDSRHRTPVVLADYSETLLVELAVIRNCSEIEAEALLVEALILTTKLRGTWSALYEGRIDVPKMRLLVDLLGPATPEQSPRSRPGFCLWPAGSPGRRSGSGSAAHWHASTPRPWSAGARKRPAGPTSAISRPETA
jgi:hypothetical protein